MPELPEVETVRRLLETNVVGKTVKDIDVYRDVNITGDAHEFVGLLRGKTLQNVIRKGKVLAFVFSSGLYVTSHLRMEGKYFFYPDLVEKEKHDILRFRFTDGSSLIYNDVRKFGRLELFDEVSFQKDSPFAELGEEPFTLNPEDLYRMTRKKSLPIKQVLMDQFVVSGIGNIYCDETLFASSIHPLTPAKEISLKDCEAILDHSKAILSKAIQAGGSTIRSYHPGKGMDGMFQVNLHAYGHVGEPCPRCGAKMHKIFVNGRGTTYCPLCQKNKATPFVIGVTGPIHSGKSTVARYLKDKGYIHFNADEVAKEAYFQKGIRSKIIALLGEESYDGDKPNYPLIRSKVAEDEGVKTKLESILHPYVKKRAATLIRKAKAGQRIVLDVPLLFPTKMEELCDATILVLAPESSRSERLEREGRDAKSLMAINAAYPLDEAKKKADLIIDNDADLDSLIRKLDALPL